MGTPGLTHVSTQIEHVTSKSCDKADRLVHVPVGCVQHEQQLQEAVHKSAQNCEMAVKVSSPMKLLQASERCKGLIIALCKQTHM